MPSIELKAVKLNYGLSEEMFNFSANLYVNGRWRNDG